ncbi:nuclear transport factor 2 family protein [Streptomyces thermocarboxydovorans]
MSAEDVTRQFFSRISNHDVTGAMDLVAPDASVRLVPLNIEGRMRAEGRAFLESLVEAFPDLYIRVRRLFVTTESVAAVEITIDGTQGGDFLGIVNQEKHLDLDLAWLLRVGPSGLIEDVQAYWCRNQLYRRLAVKRLDQISITA